MVKKVYWIGSLLATLLLACLAGTIIYKLQSPMKATPTPVLQAVIPTLSSPPAVTATASPQTAVTTTSMATSTATSSTSEASGPAIQALAPGSPVTLDKIQMVNPLVGWATGSSGLDEHILITGDGAKSWKDVSPPEPASTGAPGKRAFTFFLDVDRAWVTYFPTDFPATLPITIWSTADGGSSWQAGTLPVSSELEGGSAFDQLYFVDSQHGWLGLSHGAAAGSNPFSLHMTSDGGRSWQLLVTPFSPVSGSLDACCRNGMVFLDNLTGLVTSGNGAYLNAYVNWTRDGGLTWQNQDLTDFPAEQVDAPFCQSSSPQRLTTQSAAVVVDCITSRSDQTILHNAWVHIIADAGQLWSIFELPSPSEDSKNWASWQRSWKIQFLDSQSGFVFVVDHYENSDGSATKDASTVYQSIDGGQIWNLMGQTNWSGQFSFVDADLGWAVVRMGKDIALVSTSNGGRSWEIIQPATIQK